jgi:cytochrome P450
MTDYSHLAHANDLEPAVGHRHLREHCPLHREDTHDPPFFVVSRHADVFDVLMRPGEWCNGQGVGVFVQPGGVLGTADDPDHRRQRRVLQDAFRPRAMADLAPRVERIGRELWDAAFAHDGEGDFVRLFAFPFPAVVIAELLGVPLERRGRIRSLVRRDRQRPRWRRPGRRRTGQPGHLRAGRHPGGRT